MPEAAALAGDDLRTVCESLKIPPVLHMGSCVDNSRILVLAAELGNALNVPIHKLPIPARRRMVLAEGSLYRCILRCIGSLYRAWRDAAYSGSPAVVSLLTDGLKGAVNANFAVEPDPVKAADYRKPYRTETDGTRHMSVPAGTRAVPVSGDYNASRSGECGSGGHHPGRGASGRPRLPHSLPACLPEGNGPCD